MGRKRSPERDYVCQRCGCPCEPGGEKHLGGGRGMRACAKPVLPILRRERDAEAAAVVRAMREGRLGGRRP